MGTPQPTMAATQILVALCVVGSAVAAPQISLGRSRSAGTNINENQVVTSVITSLTPSISKAVEEALAAAAAAEQAAAEQAAAEQAAAEEAAAAAAEAERIKAAQAAQAEAARRQQIAAANAAAAAAAAEKNAFDSQVSADLGPMVNPVYNFEYKVADDEEKTYISRNGEGDGNELSGSYSFIDATGALVTVDYTAGVNGYAETRSKEAGKVTKSCSCLGWTSCWRRGTKWSCFRGQGSHIFQLKVWFELWIQELLCHQLKLQLQPERPDCPDPCSSHSSDQLCCCCGSCLKHSRPLIITTILPDGLSYRLS